MQSGNKTYYQKLHPELRRYFNILSTDIPDWLFDYINTPEMQRIGKVSMNCGTDYSGCFNPLYFHSNLDHSVGVALIIWNFTHDKTQALAGLFHDIATPVFKHCIDFMNGDHEKQESTESRTESILRNSKSINELLTRDNINIEDVLDYKKYPIADNKSPRLSADRLEYNMSCGLSYIKVWNTDDLYKIYNDITVTKNEDNEDELCFKHMEIADSFIQKASYLWPYWMNYTDRTVMQFIADIVLSLYNIGEVTIDDLYHLSEKEIINRIRKSSSKEIREAWNNFTFANKVYLSNEILLDKYSVNTKTKQRYLNPLILTKDGPQRIYDISLMSKKCIDEYLDIPTSGEYTYFDFNFKLVKERKYNAKR